MPTPWVLLTFSMVMKFCGKRSRHIRHLFETVRSRIFAPHFFTIVISLLEKLKSGDENKEAVTEQGNLAPVIFIEREDFVHFENYIKIQ